MVVDDEHNDDQGLVLKGINDGAVNYGCDKDAWRPAEWRASNDDATPVRCTLMSRDVIVDVNVEDEAVVENHLDTDGGQVDGDSLDVKTQLVDLVVLHICDVLQ